MAEKFEGWERGEDGNIVLHPLVGYDRFIPFGMACGLRVRFVRSEEEMRSGASHALPLVLSPAQARALAEDLLKMADAAERPGTSFSAQ